MNTNLELDTPYGVYLIAGPGTPPRHYGGYTIKGFKNRWDGHEKTVRAGRGYYFHNAIRAHGSGDFHLSAWIGLGAEFLERCGLDPATEAKKIEKLVIARLGLTNPETGYNLMTGGEGGVPNEATRAKMSASIKVAFQNPELLAKVRNPSPETRAKMSAANKGRKHTPEACTKISAAHRGRKFSPETRAKMSESGKRKVITPEHRAKLSTCARKNGNRTNLGREFSPEWRANLSAAQKGKPKHLSPAAQSALIAKNKKRVWTEEMRAKASAAHKGQTNPNKGKKLKLSAETRAKLSAARKGRTPWKGKHHSPESRARMSEAAKLLWTRKKAAHPLPPAPVQQSLF